MIVRGKADERRGIRDNVQSTAICDRPLNIGYKLENQSGRFCRVGTAHLRNRNVLFLLVGSAHPTGPNR